jgi:HEAT repeat protein
MPSTRLAKALATIALFNGMLFICVREELIAADKRAEAKRYLEDLRTAKTAKTRVTALQELGKLAALQKSLAADALPDIYKALEDKDPGVRAAAAVCLGQCDEPTEKAVPPLMKMLKDDKEDERVRVGAANGLAAMGTNAKEALPTLRMLAKDKNKKSNLVKAAKQATKAIAGKK